MKSKYRSKQEKRTMRLMDRYRIKYHLRYSQALKLAKQVVAGKPFFGLRGSLGVKQIATTH